MSYQALLFCPDEKTARVVTQVLTELDFSVEPATEPFATVKRLMAQHFDAVVVDCQNEQNAALLFKSARNSGINQNALAVAVVEGQAGVANAFRLGANLVLTKPINVEQSKGTLRVARGLLRKADASKPAVAAPAPTSPAVLAAPNRVTPPTQVKAVAPAIPPAAAVSSPAPVASASAFELEAEPAPSLEPADAALLESMPDAATTIDPMIPDTPAPAAKEYPWQPASKFSEPMASALRRAAEAAGRPSEVEIPAAKPEVQNQAIATPEAHDGLASRLLKASAPSQFNPTGGAAAAPAPAKIGSRPAVSPLASKSPAADDLFVDASASQAQIAHSSIPAPTIEPPTFAALSVKDHEELGGEGGRRGTLIAAVIVIAILATGYFAYTKLSHSSTAQSPAAATSASNQAPAVPAQNPASGVQSEPQQPNEASSELQNTTKTVTPLGGKTTPGKPSPAIQVESSVVAPDSVTRTQEPAPIMVQHETHKSPAPKQADPEPQPEAPSLAGLTSGASDKTISGLVSSTSASIPKPVAPQTVRVSQGVSQGLLSKRVQPVYPNQALTMHTQGVVQLQANIGKDGSITNLKVLSGDSVLAKAAVDAVRQWKYKPYYLNGEPVEIQTQVTVNFKLP